MVLFLEFPAQKASPFYEEWWFLVVIALVGLIFILLLVFILIIRGQSKKYTKKTDSGTARSKSPFSSLASAVGTKFMYSVGCVCPIQDRKTINHARMISPDCLPLYELLLYYTKVHKILLFFFWKMGYTIAQCYYIVIVLLNVSKLSFCPARHKLCCFTLGTLEAFNFTFALT